MMEIKFYFILDRCSTVVGALFLLCWFYVYFFMAHIETIDLFGEIKWFPFEEKIDVVNLKEIEQIF